MFDMTNDSDLFLELEDIETEQGGRLLGNWYSIDEKLYSPVFEGRMIHHFDHRAVSVGVQEDTQFRSGTSIETTIEEHQDPEFSALPRYWVQEGIFREELPGQDYNWFIALKDVTSATNERTLINTIIPSSAAGNSLPILPFRDLEITSNQAAGLISNLSSFVLDFAARQKVGGVHVNHYLLKQFPVHSPKRYTPGLLEYIVPRVLELTYTAWDLTAFADDVWSEAGADLQSAIESQWQSNVEATGGGHRGKTPPEWVEHSDQAREHFPHPPFMWDEERRAHLRAELDGLYGHLYDLDREELAYILDTFPIVERQDRKEYGEYRTKRLVLEAYDELEEREILTEPRTVEV